LRNRGSSPAACLHVGTGFNFRVSGWFIRPRELIAHNPATVARFAFVSGPPARYRPLGCEWTLDQLRSAAGARSISPATLIDLFRIFTRTEPTIRSALMSNVSWGEPLEDYSAIVLCSDAASGVVETGYGFP
jgi:hypothetical protein